MDSRLPRPLPINRSAAANAAQQPSAAALAQTPAASAQTPAAQREAKRARSPTGELQPRRAAASGPMPSFASLRPAQIAPNKRSPYWPAKDSGRLQTRLNCVVDLPNEPPDEAGYRTVACRHLAQAYASDANTPREFLDAVQTPEGVLSRFSGRLASTHAEFMAVCDQTPVTHRRLVSNAGFGAYLHEMALKLLQRPAAIGDKVGGDILLLTDKHAMRARMQVKKSDDGHARRICVSVYDPEVTATHRRLEVGEADELRRWRGEDFFDTRCYSDGVSDLQFVAVCPDLPPLRSDALAHVEPGVGMQISSESISLAMQHGLPQVVKAVADQLAQQGVASEAVLRMLSTAAPRDVPLLGWGLHRGHADAVLAYADLLRPLKPLEQQMVPSAIELLAARSPDGYIGLLAALKSGHADTVLAWGKAADALGLDPLALFFGWDLDLQRLQEICGDAATKAALEKITGPWR